MPTTEAPADYPRWDERHAATLTSTPEFTVEVDVYSDDATGHLVIRRTVWTRSSRRSGRHILWTGTVAIVPRAQAPDLIRDLASSLV